MIGKINVLAPIVTIPFLLTYATVEYAYFSLAMTFDIQIMRESRFMANAEVSSPTFDTSGKIKSTKHTDYGSVKVKN
jgi:potassium/chloride transporter 8